MKITDFQIERYGVWHHLALPLQSAGLNVFYGPNEAGKTTLLRFIRDVLYRVPSLQMDHDCLLPPTWNGALRIAHAGRFCELRRWAEQNGSAGVEFQELDPALAWNTEPEWSLTESPDFDSSTKEGDSAEQSLQEILAHTDPQLFRHVFAIGLNELQELATLHDDEVARQIYGLSLGLEGRKLLQICSQFQQSDEKFGFAPRISAQIAHLMKRDAELQSELEELAGQRERYQQVLEKRTQLESQVQEFQERQAELQQQLKGHEILKGVWEPWNQVREYEDQLRSLPPKAAVSEMDPLELEQLERKHRELSQKRKAILAEIPRLRKEIQAGKTNSSERQFAAEMQGFLNQRGWVEQIEREVELCSARARELKTEFEARQQVLGPEWPVHRLAAIDTSRAAYTRLVDVARTFQSAQARQASLRKRYDKYAASCHQRQADLDQHLEHLPEQSLETARDVTREQLGQVEELSHLKLKANELEQRLASQKRELDRLHEDSQVPTWVPGFLLFLAVSGLALSCLGFYTGLTSNGITGAILGLVGVAGFAIARAFQLQSQGSVEDEFARVQTTIRNHQQSLAEVRAAIKEQTPQAWVVTATDAELVQDSLETVLTAKLSLRLSDLKQIENRQRRLQSRRRKLSRMRKAIQTRQRDVAQARQAWCEVLKNCGLDETVQVEEAFELWQQITEAMEQMRAWDAARESEAEALGRYEAFCHRLADFGQRTGHTRLDYNHPLQVLDLWQQEVSTVGQESQEQLALKRELRERKREANRLKQQILKVRSARLACLAKVGATNRQDFEQRLQSASRRQELQELLQIAKEELASASQTNPELAIVEEDLRRYNAHQNQEEIDLIKMELDDLQSQSSESVEKLGRVEQELRDIESDRRPAALRAEREIITSQLRECLEQQAAIKLGAKTVQQIRGQFERKCQPELLEIASDYLSQLTCGKYVKIWTTLGEQRLRLTDEDQQTFSVEQLSNGTREQLFLALRLGLVNEFANRGIELPMVLDDVLVNFDQYRTEAAIQTLIEFAERGHQVLLFTSHLHLARLCESQGIDPVWLPAHHAAIEHRRAG